MFETVDDCERFGERERERDLKRPTDPHRAELIALSAWLRDGGAKVGSGSINAVRPTAGIHGGGELCHVESGLDRADAIAGQRFMYGAKVFQIICVGIRIRGGCS